MRKVFGIFRVRKEERWLATVVLLLFAILNALVIAKYFTKFSAIHRNYHWIFIKEFRISGFDPLSYEVVSSWGIPYQIYRHPLLAFFMYIPSQVNQGLMSLLGVNCAQFVMAALLLFFALYSFIFLFRLFHEVIGVAYLDAVLLASLTFSFAYVLLANIVPDHFALSMFMLILTLYVSGKKMARHKVFTKWQTILFFVITAGVSLNNGVKIFLANWFTNGKRFFNPWNLLFAIAMPTAAIWVFANYETIEYEQPRQIARLHMKQRMAKCDTLRTYKAFKDTTSLTDSAQIRLAVDRIMRAKAVAAKRRLLRSPVMAHQGKPIKRAKFYMWTDVTTPRAQTAVENLFGEPIVLHSDYLLGDTLTGRPVIVKYKSPVNYLVVTVVVLLFVTGIWCGRRDRLLWLAMSFFLFDMVLHMVAGFGITEVYIMSPHWLFVFGIAIAYLFKAFRGRWLNTLRVVVGCLAAYLLIHNVSLIVSYLT